MKWLKKCANGHLYKDDMEQCPYCQKEKQLFGNNVHNIIINSGNYKIKIDGEIMRKTHVFHGEALNYFEPIDTKCMYCDSGHSQETDDNYSAFLFYEKSRINTLVYKSVKYQRILIGVSRCPDCLKIHRESKLKAILVSCGIGLVVTIGFTGFIGIWIATLAILVLILIPVSQFLEKIFVRQKGIPTKRDGASRYEFVKYLIRNGWTFKKPTIY
jgi:hypothetical protein